jgi:protocatechuate 3,4-dioxygenase beta subunit
MTTRHLSMVGTVCLAMLLAGCSGSSADAPPADVPAESSTAPSVGSEGTSPPDETAEAETPAPIASSCNDPLVEQTEGPYYTPGAPERTDLTEGDTVGVPLMLTGRVLDSECAPVAGATLDFWQADGAGAYDNSGFKLRGTQVTDAEGAYTLTTVIPGLYPSRTEHIHVKVTGPDGVEHTTQLYFPDVPQNDEDGIFSDAMLVTVTDETGEGMAAAFDFVLP